MMARNHASNIFGARAPMNTRGAELYFYRLSHLETITSTALERLPFSIRILLESLLRQCDNFAITEDDVVRLAQWNPVAPRQREIPFKPARVLLQDLTGVPCLVDLAAMREAMQARGGDASLIQPQIPVDLVMDHSIQVDHFGSDDALRLNAMIELQRSQERYQFIHWGQKAFRNFRVVPPGIGIVHQVNLEYLTRGVRTAADGDATIVFPDTLVGADSHTTMVNGLGIVGWGVGGIEAEAAMLGQPVYIVTPQVIGVKITGQLPEGATATDLALTVTQTLRKRGVVDKFVEFYGPGLSLLSLPDRATIANMAPEYGATMGFFPMDAESLNYLRRTGRPEAEVALVEHYHKLQGLFRSDDMPYPEFTDTLEIDLTSIEPSLAGPKRPQDRVRLSQMKSTFANALAAPVSGGGYGVEAPERNKRAPVLVNRDNPEHQTATMGHGALVIAAITSCTNTSNPSVMIGAGLLAKKAVERGLRAAPYVKTSMSPGSRVVTQYLHDAGLLDALNTLGFNVVGYGCMTCLGNSGPLPENVAQAVTDNQLVVAAILSGNRNFEGRVNPLVKTNFLASPPLVVAYALIGTVLCDLSADPLGQDKNGKPVYLKDIWPSAEEIETLVASSVASEQFDTEYGRIFAGDQKWQSMPAPTGTLFDWTDDSTYVREPPFFIDFAAEPPPLADVQGARALAVLGDSITTDHISPAGSIGADSPAGRYLIEQGVPPVEFNSFGSRRGNHEVMLRGTFGNIRLRNLMVNGTEGPWTRHVPSGETMSIYDAAMRYQQEGTALVVIAGREYGSGSSRDWAAKGSALLGIKAVIAESYERIHRSNLVCMGVLPLQFKDGDSARSLGLDGSETYAITGVADGIEPGQLAAVTVTRADGSHTRFDALLRIDAPAEVEYFRHGGILQMVLRQLLPA